MSRTEILRTIAPAKINWTLEVLGRRSDGYHEIRSVMQTISLSDHLQLHTASTPALHVDGPAAERLTGEDNLVFRVAKAFPDVPTPELSSLANYHDRARSVPAHRNGDATS